MVEKVQELENILQENGYRVTKSRRVLIKYFLETKKHLCAEKIYVNVKNQSISLPTIYRNLLIFKSIGLIKEMNINNENVYELSVFSGKRMYVHFICRKCGQIIEYKDQMVFGRMLEHQSYIETTFGDSIEDYSAILTGVCHKCQEMVNESDECY